MTEKLDSSSEWVVGQEEVFQKLVRLSSPGKLRLGDGSNPDQYQQLGLARDILYKMGIANPFGENDHDPSDHDKPHTLNILTTSSPGNLAKLSAGVLRLIGQEGDTKRVLGYTVGPSIAFQLAPNAHEELVSDKFLSSGDPVEDGKEVYSILTSYKNPRSTFVTYQDPVKGYVRVCLPTNHFPTHHLSVGRSKIVGLEFRPMAQMKGEVSKFNHGEISFLAIRNP